MLCASAVFYCIYLSSLSRLSLFLTLSRNKVVIIIGDCSGDVDSGFTRNDWDFPDAAI